MVDRLSENNPLQSLTDNPLMLGLFGPMNKMPMCKNCNKEGNYKLKTNIQPKNQNISSHKRKGPILDPVKNRSQIEDILKNVYYNMLYGTGKPAYDRTYSYPDNSAHIDFLQSQLDNQKFLRNFYT